jgi:hypothetical protein
MKLTTPETFILVALVAACLVGATLWLAWERRRERRRTRIQAEALAAGRIRQPAVPAWRDMEMEQVRGV